MAPISYTCCYCKRSNVAQSLQGLRSHISQSAKCRARRDEEYTLRNRNRSARDEVPHTCRQPAENHEESLEDNIAPPTDDYANNCRSKRTRVNDDSGGDDDNENFQPTNVNFIIDYPEDARAGAIIEDTSNGLKSRFEKIRHAQQAAGEPVWAPFSSLADWELSRWLVQSGVSQREIDKFLKLESVRTNFYRTNFAMLNLHRDSIWCPPIHP